MPGDRTASSRRRKRVELGVGASQAQDEDLSQVSISNIRDLDDEEVIIDTEQMGKICEKLKEPDVWPQKISKQIKQRHTGVMVKLGEFKDIIATDRHRFEQAFLPLARSALAGLGDTSQLSVASNQLPIQIKFLGAEGQPLCDGFVDLLQHSKALIHSYDQLAKRTPRSSRLQEISASFGEEKKVAVKTVQAGKQVATNDVERLMTDRFHEVRRGKSELTIEDEERGRMLLSRGVEKELPPKRVSGFANVAIDTESAMEKLCFAGESDLSSP